MQKNDSHKYAKAILSAQIAVEYNGIPCHVVVWDPELAATNPGYTWPGGYFIPSGNMKHAVNMAQKSDSGFVLKDEDFQLKRIVYSRTKKHGHWIANHTFFARAQSIENILKPECKDIGVALVETSSLVGRPRIIKHIYGEAHEFDWSINDGPCIAESVFKEHLYSLMGKSFLPEIPTVNVPNSTESQMPFSFGLTVGSIILPHNYKGKSGYVCIKNNDSDNYSLIGGKVETLEGAHSRNIDTVTCIMKEAGEEIGVQLYGRSIVGCALTPWDYIFPDDVGKVKSGERNSLVNTCIHARPFNPGLLDEAIENPDKFISKREKKKIRGIYFIPEEAFYHIVNFGLMRTPDMAPLARQCLIGSHTDRPNLESIALADNKLSSTSQPFNSWIAETVKGNQ